MKSCLFGSRPYELPSLNKSWYYRLHVCSQFPCTRNRHIDLLFCRLSAVQKTGHFSVHKSIGWGRFMELRLKLRKFAYEDQLCKRLFFNQNTKAQCGHFFLALDSFSMAVEWFLPALAAAPPVSVSTRKCLMKDCE